MELLMYKFKIKSPIGELVALASDSSLYLLEFHDRGELKVEIEDLSTKLNFEVVNSKNLLLENLQAELDAYFNGQLLTFKTPLSYFGTEFQERVWRSLHEIPFGETRTYKEQSEHLGDVKAIRAVASANGKNRLAIIVPCHRVIGSNGNLPGYAGGIERKRFLLDLERKFGGPKDLFN